MTITRQVRAHEPRTRGWIFFWLMALTAVLGGNLASATSINVEGGGTLSFTVKSSNTLCNPLGLNGPLPGVVIANTDTDFYYSGSPVTNSTIAVRDILALEPPCGTIQNTATVLTLQNGCSIDFYAETETATLNCTGTPVYVHPKYVILGIVYAAPGPQSFVQYTTTTSAVTTTSLSNSFSQSNAVSSTVGVSDSVLKGVFNASVTATETSTTTQSSSDGTTATLSTQFALSDKIFGTPNAYAPVNHDYDTIYLWLNPVALFTVLPQPYTGLQWNGFAFDEAWGSDGMEIVPVQVGQLNGDFPIDPSLASILDRTWANYLVWPSGETPALTATDLATILAADPFSNSAYTPILAGSSNTTTDGRFTEFGTQSLPYIQPEPGQTPSNRSITATTTSTNSTTNTQSYSFKQSYGIDVSLSAAAKLVSDQLKDTTTLTWTYQYTVTNSATNQVGQQISVTGPPCSGNPCSPQYAGPGEFVAFQDNLWGTFVAIPPLALGTAPTVQSGMTWGMGGYNYTYQISDVECDTTTADCNPYTGDTSCSVSLPILCVDPAGEPNPGFTPVPSAFYDGWVGGPLGLSTPVQGISLTAQSAADNVCSLQYGPGWRMAEFHDGGGGWGYRGYDFLYEQLPWTATPVPNPPRFWVRISDQPANCWN